MEVRIRPGVEVEGIGAAKWLNYPPDVGEYSEHASSPKLNASTVEMTQSVCFIDISG